MLYTCLCVCAHTHMCARARDTRFIHAPLEWVYTPDVQTWRFRRLTPRLGRAGCSGAGAGEGKENLLGLAEPNKTKELALGVVVHGAVLPRTVSRACRASSCHFSWDLLNRPHSHGSWVCSLTSDPIQELKIRVCARPHPRGVGPEHPAGLRAEGRADTPRKRLRRSSCSGEAAIKPWLRPSTTRPSGGTRSER